MNNILNFIISFLGGGITAAILNWIRTSRSERNARKNEFIKEQLTKVYGPLFFFVELNEDLISLNGKLQKACTDYFGNTEWSRDSNTRQTLREESKATIELANEYARLVRVNNSKIVDLLRDNYAYIDPEDSEIFIQFIIDYFRMEREVNDQKPLKVPLELYSKIGEIFYSRQEFNELVKKKFVEKKNVIKSMQSS